MRICMRRMGVEETFLESLAPRGYSIPPVLGEVTRLLAALNTSIKNKLE